VEHALNEFEKGDIPFGRPLGRKPAVEEQGFYRNAYYCLDFEVF